MYGSKDPSENVTDPELGSITVYYPVILPYLNASSRLCVSSKSLGSGPAREMGAVMPRFRVAGAGAAAAAVGDVRVVTVTELFTEFHILTVWGRGGGG
jgi:hypothetical protein